MWETRPLDLYAYASTVLGITWYHDTTVSHKHNHGRSVRSLSVPLDPNG
jgi:hypothetical protein